MTRKIVLAALLVPLAGAHAQTVQLSLQKAVEIATERDGNARVRIARELIRQAEARSATVRAALLPDVSGAVTQQNQTRNLAALGIRVQVPIPGFTFPTFVGPFNTFDARALLTQNVVDLAAIRRFQAARATTRAVEAESEATREAVAEQTARAYLAAARADASLETARANVALAEALLKLAGEQKQAGTGTGIEVTRARVQIANERHRLLDAGHERTRARLQLLRAMGLELNTTFELTDRLAYRAAPAMTEEQALLAARQTRPEWKAQQGREASARISYSAAAFERLPSLVGFADYGSIGSSINHAVPTRTYGLSLRIPVFDGGRRDAHRAEAASQLRVERTRTSDLWAQIEMEVRVALDALRASEEQVKAAAEGLSLAEAELAQARRRYEAGVAPGIEVTDAQTRLARAQENNINALFNHSLARIELAAATGSVRQAIP